MAWKRGMVPLRPPPISVCLVSTRSSLDEQGETLGRRVHTKTLILTLGLWYWLVLQATVSRSESAALLIFFEGSKFNQIFSPPPSLGNLSSAVSFEDE